MLVYDLDDTVWYALPGDESQIEEWLEAFIPVAVEEFGVVEDDDRLRIDQVLSNLARTCTAGTGDGLIHWPDLEQEPLIARVAAFEREGPTTDELDRWVRALDDDPVEPAIVDELVGAEGSRVVRGVAYSQGVASLVVSVRYAIDAGDAGAIGVLYAASGVPGALLGAVEDFDDLARSVTFLPEAP